MSDVETRQSWSNPLKALASYLAQAEAGDRSFIERGLCRRYMDTEAWLNWVAVYHEGAQQKKRTQHEQTERAKAALMVCANCSVQFECAKYGVQTDAIAGIYGVRDSSLQWLRRYGKGSLLDKLLEEGKRSGESVEVFVLRKRQMV